MATRAIYFPIAGYPYCREQTVSFTWSKSSKRQNIRAVHEALHATAPDVSVLEVSSASAQPEGEAVSTLRLLLHLASAGQDVPVSTAFEASKVFEKGGPYTDLLGCEPPRVHKDERLRNSGVVLRYLLEGAEYPREPYPDAFFEWLYCTALRQAPEKAEPLGRYGAFSDIAAAADSRKYYGDASRAAAIYAGLAMAGKLECIASFEAFVAEVYENKAVPEPAGEPVQTEMLPQEAPPEATTEAPTEAPTEGQAEAPEGEPTQPAGNNGGSAAIPNVEQLAQLVGQPRAVGLLVSLGKSVGFSAKSSVAMSRRAKDYLLCEYRKAQRSGTLQLNREKNKVTFPLEYAENNFRAVGQLTRSPVLEQGWRFSYQPCNTIQPPADVQEYLERCGFVVARKVGPDDLPPIAVQRLAWQTGEALCDPAVAEFLQGIRAHSQYNGQFSVRYPKGKKSIATVTELAQAWEKMGLFASVVFYSPQNITCTLGESDVVRSFLSGKWLELFAMHQVQETLEQYRQEHGGEYSVYANVALSDVTCNQNELDVAFLLNGEFFWVEAKSSSKGINYGKYVALCKKLKVKPDHLLLINSELTEEECEGISYFWNYRVANCVTLKQKLEEMICQQMGQAVPTQPADAEPAAEDAAAEPPAEDAGAAEPEAE